MQRILITGNAGSGKTTLGKQLAQILNIQLRSLDEVVWEAGWKTPAPAERIERIAELIKAESWMIDGVSKRVLEAADTVIFLDFPRRVSYWRVCKRNWKYLFCSRPGLPEKCPEILMVKRLVKIIWRFQTEVRPVILKKLEMTRTEKNVFHVKSSKELNKLIFEFKNMG